MIPAPHRLVEQSAATNVRFLWVLLAISLVSFPVLLLALGAAVEDGLAAGALLVLLASLSTPRARGLWRHLGSFR